VVNVDNGLVDAAGGEQANVYSRSGRLAIGTSGFGIPR